MTATILSQSKVIVNNTKLILRHDIIEITITCYLLIQIKWNECYGSRHSRELAFGITPHEVKWKMKKCSFNSKFNKIPIN